MKKIIALALALIMALSMASVAFAAVKDEKNYDDLMAGVYYLSTGAQIEVQTTADGTAFPGNVYEIPLNAWNLTTADMKNYKLSNDFTKGEFDGASMIKDIRLNKQKTTVVVELKESYTMAEETAKTIMGQITFTHKTQKDPTTKLPVSYSEYVVLHINNGYDYFEGAKKAADADTFNVAPNFVNIFEKAGYIKLNAGTELKGTVQVAKNDKVYFNTVDLKTADEDSYDALMDLLGDDYEGIVEMYSFETKAAEDVDWTYKAWAEDPHFFYAWNGEKLTQIEAKYDDDEDVDAYVFTADAAGTILVVDEEIVLAAEEETKNPDTGANDVVGVAAALAVVSLVAAGAVSLKK